MDVERRDQHGRTPLMAACLMKHDAIVAVLIEGRANVNAKDRAGFAAKFSLNSALGRNFALIV